MIVQTQGIVLKTFDLRETSRIAFFFTKDHGKVKGVLKGIRKDPKKFGSYIDKFSVNDLVYYQSRQSDLHLVSQCDLREYFFLVRQDYKRNLAANYALELINTIMPAEQENKEIYELLLKYLESLGTILDIDKLVYMFQIKTLLFSGFRPHLDCCVKCGKKVKARAQFSLKSGGLVCAHCPLDELKPTLISQGAVASILHIERSEWEKCLRLGLAASVKKELKYILNHFLVYHLERQLKTARYL